MIISYDCFIEETKLNLFGSSKHLFKVFLSSFLPLIFIIAALIIFSFLKIILWKWIRLIWWILIAIITILFNLYSSTTSLILCIFNCQTIESTIRLRRDYELKCWVDAHARWAFFYGVPMLVFFVFGLPIFGILVLFLNRNKLG